MTGYIVLDDGSSSNDESLTKKGWFIALMVIIALLFCGISVFLAYKWCKNTQYRYKANSYIQMQAENENEIES